MSTGGETGTSEGRRSRGTSPGARSDALSSMSGVGAIGAGGTPMQTAAQMAMSITQNMPSSTEPSMRGPVRLPTEPTPASRVVNFAYIGKGRNMLSFFDSLES